MDIETKKLIALTIPQMLATMLLVVILNGGTVDIYTKNFNQDDYKYLAAAMELENSSGGDECLLLTGSVILNRMNSYKWNGDTVYDVIWAKEGKYWQYAEKTRKNLDTIIVSKRTRMLAAYLLTYGPICPENVMYQSQNPNNGSEIYKKIKVTGGKYEYFAYE